MKKKVFISLLIMFLSINNAYSEMFIKLELLSNEEYNKSLFIIGKILIDKDVLSLYDRNNYLLAEQNLNEVKKISFTKDINTTTPTKDETISTKPQIIIYPNPTENTLIINGTNENDIIRIYSIDGNLLFQENSNTTKRTLNVNELSSGTYLLQVGINIVKFIKH